MVFGHPVRPGDVAGMNENGCPEGFRGFVEGPEFLVFQPATVNVGADLDADKSALLDTFTFLDAGRDVPAA